MRKIIISFIFFLVAGCLKAQYPGYQPVTDIVKFKTEFTTASKKILSIKSDFTQEKNLSMLSEKIISKGKFWFKKENMVRMEYVQPYQYLMVINKDKIFVKDGQKENKISVKSNKVFQKINKIMLECMQGNALDNTDFTTRVFENKNTAIIELTPVTKGLKELFKSINISIDKRDFSVTNFLMQEISGDNTLIRFTNKELNATIPDTLFFIK